MLDNIKNSTEDVKEIYFVTGNNGKFEEVRDFVASRTSKIVIKQYKVDLFEAQTLDQKSIALSKAMQAWDVVKKPLLIDDTGVYFKKYNEFPGALAKFVFQGIGYEGILKLVHDDPRAELLVYLIYVDGPESYHIFQGQGSGTIVPPNGITGHPELSYGAIFVPDGSPDGKTYAQLRGTPDESNFIYRLQAVQKFLDWHLSNK